MSIGLNEDSAVGYRSSTDIDAEGNSVGGWAEVWRGKGFLGTVSARDARVAGELGTDTSAVFAAKLPSPDTLQAGDRLDVRGVRWQVRWVEDVRAHFRVFLRRIEG